ncbi:hypothetical protein EM868_12975 [Cupriavidus gilardii]|uniref:hypothetical protein n=1 Tax=Cupriavidus gilardii TaxID=82541 RepID=UPI001EE5B55E|nr:hypothetical protein [Cupriavidus gilardii]MCG5262094.1 hypothetical protein [Cupriavidus gilardii]MDF9430704.1 hypothetical protein [Cupriavidus gilardii]
MQTTRTPLLSPHLATSRATLDIDSPHERGYGQFRETRITIDTDARLDGPREPFWLTHPKLTGVLTGAVAFGLVAGASGITFAATHDWLAAGAVFGLGNALMGCVGSCILNRVSGSSA